MAPLSCTNLFTVSVYGIFKKYIEKMWPLSCTNLEWKNKKIQKNSNRKESLFCVLQSIKPNKKTVAFLEVRVSVM